MEYLERSFFETPTKSLFIKAPVKGCKTYTSRHHVPEKKLNTVASTFFGVNFASNDKIGRAENAIPTVEKTTSVKIKNT